MSINMKYSLLAAGNSLFDFEAEAYYAELDEAHKA